MCVLPTRTAMAHTTNPRRLRLAYVTTLPQTQWAFLRGQNGYLAARGFELHAVASPGPSLARLVERDGVVAHPVPIARAISPLRDCVALARLFLVFRRIQPDIVHVSTPKAALLGAIAALARAASDPQAVFVGFVGRLARDKGIEQIARAWERIREEFHGTQLLLVGAWDAEGPIASRWRAALERDPRVHLPGRVDDVVPYYRRMSLLLFPSHGTEGFPHGPMEAAAVGPRLRSAPP